jgi:hypothetical protein
MRKVLLPLTLAALFTTSSLMAAGEFNLQSAKEKAKEQLNKQIKVLEGAKECVEKSSNKAEFSACKEKTKIDLQAVKKSK